GGLPSREEARVVSVRGGRGAAHTPSSFGEAGGGGAMAPPPLPRTRYRWVAEPAVSAGTGADLMPAGMANRLSGRSALSSTLSRAIVTTTGLSLTLNSIEWATMSPLTFR